MMIARFRHTSNMYCMTVPIQVIFFFAVLPTKLFKPLANERYPRVLSELLRELRDFRTIVNNNVVL
jgi:hypothetical protein